MKDSRSMSIVNVSCVGSKSE